MNILNRVKQTDEDRAKTPEVPKKSNGKWTTINNAIKEADANDGRSTDNPGKGATPPQSPKAP